MTESAKPWLSEYRAFGIPESLRPYPDKPVHSLLAEAAEEFPDAGVVQSGRTFTYAELQADVERFATALRARGVGEGDRVATVLPTSAQFLVAEHAITRAGGVHVPNDFLTAEDDLAYRLERADPTVLVGDAAHRDALADLRTTLDVDHLVLTALDDYSDDPPTHDETGEASDAGGAGVTGGVGDADGVEWLPDLLAETDPDPPEIDVDPESTVHTLLFTGGTTGRPKGCRLSHRNVLANAQQAVASMSNLASLLRGSESALFVLPIYHAYGYSIAHALVALPVTMLLVSGPRDTAAMADLVGRHDPVLMFGVPTQFMELVDEELDAEVVGISGSAPLAGETKSAFERESVGVSQGYGLSEMSPISHFDVRGIYDMIVGNDGGDGGAVDAPTIGVPVPDTEVELVDVDTGEPIPLDRAVEEEVRAEMYLDGPQRMLGYLDGDGAPFDDEGFVRTGDVVRVDERGRFYVVDRVKDMINVSGLKVYSEEMDEVLHRHPDVARPATVGVPDPERPGSERVKVYVEPKPGADLTADDVRSFLAGKVPAHAMPSTVEFVERIPQTAIGKTDKNRLRERHDGEHGDAGDPERGSAADPEWG